MKVRIRVDEDRTDEEIARMRSKIGDVLRAGGALVAAEAERRAPRQKTGSGGELAGSMAVVEVDDRTVAVQAQAPYSHIVELGGHGQPARPFLRPALVAVKGRIVQMMQEAFRA